MFDEFPGEFSSEYRKFQENTACPREKSRRLLTTSINKSFHVNEKYIIVSKYIFLPKTFHLLFAIRTSLIPMRSLIMVFKETNLKNTTLIPCLYW